MKLLDRYVLHIFLAALVVFLVALLALFLVIDFSTKLPRFLALRSVSFLPFVAEYYLCRVPMYLTLVLPTLTLFAAMFTMIKLQKTNEVLPIVAAGVSMRRLAVPFVLVSLVAGALVAAIDEFVLPPLTPRIGDTDEILLTEEMTYGRVAYDARGNHIWAASYDHVRKEMHDVVLSKFSTDLKHELIANARLCRWDEPHQRWVLLEGTMFPYDAEGNSILNERPGAPPQRRSVPIPQNGFTLDSDILPQDLQRKMSVTGQYYSLSEINERLQKHPQDAKLQIMRHAKFSTPLSSLVILLLGLPFVVSTRQKGFFRGLTLCLIVTAAYYAVSLGAMELGKTDRLAPQTAAWLATTAFGMLGIALFWRMRS